jgi:hypothetical protein
MGRIGAYYGASFVVDWGGSDYRLPRLPEPQSSSEDLAQQEATIEVMAEWNARRERAAQTASRSSSPRSSCCRQPPDDGGVPSVNVIN